VRELHLPDNGSYRRYADLQRPYVVWNVFAAEEFSTQPKQWCFPIAGCVGYRGYFAKADAETFAAELRAQALDVYVAGVPAYSTLGWMDDPVLNTFVHYPEAEVARLMFHELAHQVVYLPGDTTFNESFASTVELEGVHRWLEHTGSTQGVVALEAAQRRSREFTELVVRYRDRLAALYASGKPAPEMRAEKARAFAQMREAYGQLKRSWGGFSGYDGWFAQPLNNAQLASVAVYTELVPAFQALLADCGGDLQRFYAAAGELATLDQTTRVERLARLEAQASPSQ